jgi:hypothetical protein
MHLMYLYLLCYLGIDTTDRPGCIAPGFYRGRCPREDLHILATVRLSSQPPAEAAKQYHISCIARKLSHMSRELGKDVRRAYRTVHGRCLPPRLNHASELDLYVPVRVATTHDIKPRSVRQHVFGPQQRRVLFPMVHFDILFLQSTVH